MAFYSNNIILFAATYLFICVCVCVCVCVFIYLFKFCNEAQGIICSL